MFPSAGQLQGWGQGHLQDELQPRCRRRRRGRGWGRCRPRRGRCRGWCRLRRGRGRGRCRRPLGIKLLLFLKFKTLFVTWGNVGVGVEGSRGSGRELLDSCRGSFFTKVFKPPFFTLFYLQALECRDGFIIPVLKPFLVSLVFFIPAGAVAAEKWSAGAVAARKWSAGAVAAWKNMELVNKTN